jgi:threonine/homoserine/homoserine lactone efflux protein
MTEAIVSGMVLGVVLAFLIGPVFFLLLDTSIKKGFKVAAYLALGVMLSDAFFIIITYFSSSAIQLMQDYKKEIGIGGGVLLIIFGVLNFIKKPHIKATELDLADDRRSLWIDTSKGFMMNLLNPFTLLFWIGVSGGVAVKFQSSDMHTVIFYSVVLATVLATDLLKAWLAAKLKRFLKPGVLVLVNKISGVGLILFGCRLVYLILLEKAA